MKTTKKVLLVFAVILFVCTLCVSVFAATEEYADAALMVDVLGFNLPDGDTILLNQPVKKYQVALLIAEAITGKTDLALWNIVNESSVFSDVKEYGSAIDYLYGHGIVKGVTDTTFGYSNGVTYMEMLAYAVNALGYGEESFIYPYDHILAAEKLGFCDGISTSNYTKVLTFGEVSHIFWCMLNTEVAVVDSFNGEILYPGEAGMTEAMTGKHIERRTLLEETGFFCNTLDAVIVGFYESDGGGYDDIVVIDYIYDRDGVPYMVGGVEISASALGITADTPKASFLGLPVTLYVDCRAEDFEWEYARGYATVIYADFAEYTTVENIGDEDNIKLEVNALYALMELTLGDKVFAWNYDNVYVSTFSEYGWVRLDDDEVNMLLAMFEYSANDGYVNYIDYANTYCSMAYRVIGDTNDDGIEELEILYTPYEFGQYVERELTYAVTSKPANFTLIGNFGDSIMDGEETKITERFVGSNTILTDTKKSVSKIAGERACEVTVTGVDVASGDFMFYSYNYADNNTYCS